MALTDTAEVLGLSEQEMLDILGSPQDFSDGQAEALAKLFLPDDREDAFVEQRGSRFAVIQGNNGRQLSSWGTKQQADDEVDRLHRKNKPKTTNRGGQAKERHKTRERADGLGARKEAQRELASGLHHAR